jgi:hypothetical protein
MNKKWFRKVGLLFIPETLLGWLLLLAAVSLMGWALTAAPTTNTLLFVVPAWLVIIAVGYAIAWLTSR